MVDTHDKVLNIISPQGNANYNVIAPHKHKNTLINNSQKIKK